jgi:hypothetical protein
VDSSPLTSLQQAGGAWYVFGVYLHTLNAVDFHFLPPYHQTMILTAVFTAAPCKIDPLQPAFVGLVKASLSSSD